VTLGTVAIDDTKVKANASRHKAMSFERMKQSEAELKSQIHALLQRAKRSDEAEAQTQEGRAAYRRCKWIAVPPNCWIEHVLGFRQFSLRGGSRRSRPSGSSCAWR
jgi:hypothetical protein